MPALFYERTSCFVVYRAQLTSMNPTMDGHGFKYESTAFKFI